MCACTGRSLLSQGTVYLLQRAPSAASQASTLEQEGAKPSQATQGLGHILVSQVQNSPKANILVHEWLMCCTWVVCKPFNFYVLSTWEMLSRAAVFDQQTPQRLLVPHHCLRWSQDQPQKLLFQQPKGLSLSFCIRNGKTSLSFCMHQRGHCIINWGVTLV